MKTFLSIDFLERHGLDVCAKRGIDENTKVYGHTPNKGFRLMGTPSLKQKYDSPTIEINGDITDIRAFKTEAYLFVDININ